MSKTSIKPGDEYKCEACGGIFKTEWTDEESKAEYKDIFGAEPTDKDDAIVCEDCYNKIMNAASKNN